MGSKLIGNHTGRWINPEPETCRSYTPRMLKRFTLAVEDTCRTAGLHL